MNRHRLPELAPVARGMSSPARGRIPYISFFDGNGKVIFSTLPDGPNPGAELFLHLSHKEMGLYLESCRNPRAPRLCFCGEGRGILLYTGGYRDCGIAIGVHGTLKRRFARFWRGRELAVIALPPEAEAFTHSDHLKSVTSAEANVGEAFIDPETLNFTAVLDWLYCGIPERTLCRTSRDIVKLLLRYSSVTESDVSFTRSLESPFFFAHIDTAALGIFAALCGALSTRVSEIANVEYILSEKVGRLWIEAVIKTDGQNGGDGISRKSFGMQELENALLGLRQMKNKHLRISEHDGEIRIKFAPGAVDIRARGIKQRSASIRRGRGTLRK